MADYKTMYHKMFNAATNAGRLMEKAVIIIKAAQIECEELYLQTENTPVTLPDKLAEMRFAPHEFDRR